MQLRNIMVVFAMVLSLVSMQVFAHGADDTALTKSVTDKLSSDADVADMLKTHKIKVHAKNGEVTVSGKVESDDQIKSISDSVKAVEGVKGVDVKHLKVEKAKMKAKANAKESKGTQGASDQESSTKENKSSSSY